MSQGCAEAGDVLLKAPGGHVPAGGEAHLGGDIGVGEDAAEGGGARGDVADGLDDAGWVRVVRGDEVGVAADVGGDDGRAAGG